MTRDANQIAQEAARRERPTTYTPGARVPAVRGTLTIWRSLDALEMGKDPIARNSRVVVDLTRPGQIIAYDADGNADIFYPDRGWYVTFVPDRHEGE